MQDWKDALGALINSGELPEGNPPESDAVGEAFDMETKRCRHDKSLPGIKFFYEKKGRAGKPATILTGFYPSMTDDEIDDVARRLKQRLGCGGSARGGEILLQGDRRDQARTLLAEWGFRVSK